MAQTGKYDPKKRFRQNNWIAGETGRRISALREDDLYKVSSNLIENLLITELGTLKVAKQYDKNVLAEITGDVIKVIDTRFNFIIVITTEKVMTIKREDFSILSTFPTVLNKNDNVTFIDTFVFLPTKVVEVTDLDLGTLAENTAFRDHILMPLEDRSTINVDIYQVRKMKVDNPVDGGVTQVEETSPYKIGTVENPEIEMKDDGLLYLKDTNYKITRFYINYQSELGYRHLEGLTENEFFLSIHNFLESENAGFVLGNKPVVFNEADKVTDDVTGEYYKKFTGIAVGENGQLDYGIPINIFDGFTDLQEFQNRMVIAFNGKLYFSAIADYNNFRNSILDADPFFFKLSPINSEEGNILRLVTGRGLYVITDKGVYICGYESGLTPSALDVRLASDDEATNNVAILDDALFFMNTDKEIKCIQNISEKTTRLDFKAYLVDKFSLKKDYGTIGICRVEGVKYMFANSLEGGKIYLFKPFDIGNFVRTTLEIDDTETKFTGELTGHKENFFGTGLHFVLTNKNKPKASLQFNIPSLHTNIGGYYLNDISTRLERFVLKILDEEYNGEKAVDYISYNGEVFNRMGDNVEGIHSIYKLETGSELYTTKTINIYSKENENVLEIQAYELFFNVQGD